MSSIKVAVNGYGVIGERVADAVAAQPDMELADVAELAPRRMRSDYGARAGVCPDAAGAPRANTPARYRRTGGVR